MSDINVTMRLDNFELPPEPGDTAVRRMLGEMVTTYIEYTNPLGVVMVQRIRSRASDAVWLGDDDLAAYLASKTDSAVAQQLQDALVAADATAGPSVQMNALGELEIHIERNGEHVVVPWPNGSTL
jgi:hypothetical protein